jgi:ATP-binding cassette subfamily B protein
VAAIAINSPASLNAGVLVAFTMLSGRLAAPLVQIVKMQLDLGEVKTAIAEVSAIMNSPPEENRANGLKMPITGEISFQDVRFRYSLTAPYALEGVNFTVPKGTMLGIMGRSGSGKTTVTRLLQRLNSSYEGMIKIDGMDLREVDLTHLRTHIGVVPQENFLFSGTIRENIAMAKPDASFMDVVRAAQLAGAEEFIERLPRGYDTVLEEGATNLSGGQRQRLAIARALLVNPPVLILDEATANIDTVTEQLLEEVLAKLPSSTTKVIIAHRLNTIRNADEIFFVGGGGLTEAGSMEHAMDMLLHNERST